MHHVVLDRWSRGSSVLHERVAEAKLLVLLVFLVCLATQRTVLNAIALSYFTLLLLGLAVARLPLAAAMGRAAVVLPFSATFAAVSWVAGDERRAVELIVKSYLSALAVLLIVGTTPMPHLMRALERFGTPRMVVLTVQFLYRYLFVISEQAQHMMLAARCRAPGARLTFQGAASALSVLFARSAERAVGIHRAMIARGFDGRFPIVQGRQARTSDYMFAAVMTLVLLALRVSWSAGAPWIR